MLKATHPLLGPELLFTLASMGHGDVVALVDRNYPSYSTNDRVIRLDGVDCVEAARAILGVLPLDASGPAPVAVMEDTDRPGVLLDAHRQVLAVAEEYEGRDLTVEAVGRLEFYDRVRRAYAVVMTSESRAFSCFLLTKGVVPAS